MCPAHFHCPPKRVSPNKRAVCAAWRILLSLCPLVFRHARLCQATVLLSRPSLTAAAAGGCLSLPSPVCQILDPSSTVLGARCFGASVLGSAPHRHAEFNTDPLCFVRALRMFLAYARTTTATTKATATGTGTMSNGHVHVHVTSSVLHSPIFVRVPPLPRVSHA